jgi:2-hydroxychromene-2-carboxylate isomerase
MTTQIDFFFDPGCPWCWVTSRWLEDVRSQRELDVTWRSFSLWDKNGRHATNSHAELIQTTHRSLRVVEAVRSAEGDAPIGKLYTELGKRFHHDKAVSDDSTREAIAAAGLAASFGDAIDNVELDEAITSSMKVALDAAGNDVGVPLLVRDGRGYFGPVLTPAPTGADAVKLWDALDSMLSLGDGFWELKRTRTSGPIFGNRPE